MIDAEGDVLDAVDDVRARDRERALRGGDLDPRLRWPHQRGELPAVGHLDAYEHVGDRALEPRELDTASGEPALAQIDRAALEERVGQVLYRRCCEVARALRELQDDREAHAGQHRRAPQEVTATGLRLLDLEEGGADLVRTRTRHERREQDEHEYRRLHAEPPITPGRCPPRDGRPSMAVPRGPLRPSASEERPRSELASRRTPAVGSRRAGLRSIPS